MNQLSTAAFLVAATVITPGLSAQIGGAGGISRLWEDHCAKCHGVEGEGGGAGTRTLLNDDLFDQSNDRPFFDAIKNGLPDQGMEAYGPTMSDQQIWALVVHIRELQQRERRARLGSPTPRNAPETTVFNTLHHAFRVENVVTRGLETPWSIEFISASPERMLIADRPGDIRIFEDGKLGKPIAGVPAVRNRGQGGLMDVVVPPNYNAATGRVFLSYSDEIRENDRSLGMTKIVSATLADGGLSDLKTVFEAKSEHYLPTDLHFGCKIDFDPADPTILYFAIGERGRMEMAQDLTRPNGKVHRVRTDGSIPEGNPFADQASRDRGVYPSIWSYGHRNPQGLIFDLQGNLWDTEHGPRGGDELNLIKKGANYGWPIVSFGINYNDSPFRTPWPDLAESAKDKDVEMPVDRWLPSIGACGLTVVRGGPSGEAFPEWRGDLLAGGLSGANVDRFRIKDGKVVEREEIFHGRGRVRDVTCGPDGSVYIVLNGPDRVVRLTPAERPAAGN